jgi:hypothetical protein
MSTAPIGATIWGDLLRSVAEAGIGNVPMWKCCQLPNPMLPISQRQEVIGNGELELATLETGNNPSRPCVAAQNNRPPSSVAEQPVKDNGG